MPPVNEAEIMEAIDRAKREMMTHVEKLNESITQRTIGESEVRGMLNQLIREMEKLNRALFGDNGKQALLLRVAMIEDWMERHRKGCADGTLGRWKFLAAVATAIVMAASAIVVAVLK